MAYQRAGYSVFESRFHVACFCVLFRNLLHPASAWRPTSVRSWCFLSEHAVRGEYLLFRFFVSCAAVICVGHMIRSTFYGLADAVCSYDASFCCTRIQKWGPLSRWLKRPTDRPTGISRQGTRVDDGYEILLREFLAIATLSFLAMICSRRRGCGVHCRRVACKQRRSSFS